MSVMEPGGGEPSASSRVRRIQAVMCLSSIVPDLYLFSHGQNPGSPDLAGGHRAR